MIDSPVAAQISLFNTQLKVVISKDGASDGNFFQVQHRSHKAHLSDEFDLEDLEDVDLEDDVFEVLAFLLGILLSVHVKEYE